MPQGYDPLYDEDPQQDSPLVKNLRERGDKAEKRNKELEEQLAKLSSKARKADVVEVLKGKSVNPAISRFILQDIEGDVTPEAVDAWLKENGEIFGVKTEEAAPAAQGEPQEPIATDPRLAAVQAAQARMAQAEQGAQTPIGEDALMAKLQDPSLTPKDLYALLGATDGPSYYYDFQNR